ncbi:hypothetical protein KsCSTR_42250 [Candidatus Kuenenia stuttgartiensis]|uniref:Uncharacterized protein n=1 Tax=Kuenenia stuttgartiensis TaxID=174633 RepID=A0A6G7GVR6_KUEST|nr:hypothetical protein KsCSTR_42250 [Candidatus Kuenenia stuttgartiensis]
MIPDVDRLCLLPNNCGAQVYSLVMLEYEARTEMESVDTALHNQTSVLQFL